MAFAYGAAGLTLLSNVRLPHLPPARFTAADFVVHVGLRPPWTSDPMTAVYSSPHSDRHGVPVLQLTRGTHGFLLQYADGSRFWLDASGSCVWTIYESTLEDAWTYLIGPVLSFALRLRGDFSLHASAVATASGAVAFAGPHGVGKSTTAAALGRRGLPVVTDDVLRLTQAGDTWLAHPVGGILRLWPNGESLLFGDDAQLHAITPNWSKRALTIGEDGVPGTNEALPLRAIVFLTPDETANRAAVTPLPPAQAALRLAANSSAAHLLDTAARVCEFHQVAAIAASVPCAVMTRPLEAPSLEDTLTILTLWFDCIASTTVASGS